jgi:putative heme-binding domain-containing protein
LIEQRTATAVQLAGSDGTRKEVPLAEIESIKDSGVSLMPEGIETKLDPGKLADLLDYVRTKN